VPLYAMIAKDKPNGVADRMAVRPEHLKHLDSLGTMLLFAGPIQDEQAQPTGTLAVIEAANMTEAQDLFAKDPYIRKGVFQSYEITRWNWVINNPERRGQ